jgi:hypothetical protein
MGEFHADCAELGMIFIAPDASPRGEGLQDDPEVAYASICSSAPMSTQQLQVALFNNF